MATIASRSSSTLLSKALLAASSRTSTCVVKQQPSSMVVGALESSCHQRCSFSTLSPLRLRRPNEPEEVQVHQYRLQRPHAVTLFPGDYSDDEEDDYDPQDMWEEEADEDFEAELMGDDEAAAELAIEEELRMERRERWLENDRPPLRQSEIDRLGRAYGRGGRKTASARVWIQPGTGEVVINRKSFVDYFDRQSDRELILAPFLATDTCGLFDLQATVYGGGLTGQAGAIKYGLSKALNSYNPDLYRAPLKVLGFLTRDARIVERKKVGKLKARKSPQWVRR